MNKKNDSLCLEEEITLLRGELNNLLDIKPVNSLEVLELSIRLDELIAEYYHQKDNTLRLP